MPSRARSTLIHGDRIVKDLEYGSKASLRRCEFAECSNVFQILDQILASSRDWDDSSESVGRTRPCWIQRQDAVSGNILGEVVTVAEGGSLIS
jgi:hypothetical protein